MAAARVALKCLSEDGTERGWDELATCDMNRFACSA